MGDVTAIAWTDRTFNPAIGCTKVGPGCDNCYAERDMAIRRKYVVWGPGAERRRTSPEYWRKPLKWEREAAESGTRLRVFCASLADVFDKEWPDGVREDLWDLIERTPHLDWQPLTKRIGRWRDCVPKRWVANGFPANVHMGITVVNQVESDRDIPKLLEVPARIRWLSIEPQLDLVDLARFLEVAWSPTLRRWKPLRVRGSSGLHWIVTGGESGPHARPYRVEWAFRLLNQCRAAGVPFFMKQMGAFVIDRNDAGFDAEWNDNDPRAWPLAPDGSDPDVEHDIHGFREEYQGADCRIRLQHRAGADPREWPACLRVREFPKALDAATG